MGIYEIQAGYALEGIIAGGGGFGDPLDRDPEFVRRDVRRGWVTAEKASETYGVVLDFTPELFAVKPEETKTLRSKLRKRRESATAKHGGRGTTESIGKA